MACATYPSRGTLPRAEYNHAAWIRVRLVGFGFQGVIDPTFAALVERIYAAALEPARWRQVLLEISLAMDGLAADLTALSPSTESLRFHTSTGGWGEEFQRHYLAHVGQDPFLLRARQLDLIRPGVIGVGQRMMSDGDYRRTGFFHDFGRHYEYFGGITAVLDRTASGLTALSVGLPGGAIVDEQRLSRMQALVPHLQRALAIQQRLASSDRLASDLRRVVDAVSTGAVLTDSSGRVLFMNAAAEAIVRAGNAVTISRGILCAKRAHETSALRKAISAAATGKDAARSGHLMTISRGDRRPLHALVAPAPRPDDPYVCQEQRAIVFLTDPDGTPRHDASVLSRIYGLTEAESTVAGCLLRGLSVKETASALQVSVNTIRFHVRNLLGKTGTNRQATLIRLLQATVHAR